jgi:hypothetical protein
MASVNPTYILAPNWDFLPTGPIALGSLITDPRDPKRSLNKNALIPIPPTEIVTTSKEDWSITREQLLSGSVGIWASFLAPLLGVGADLALNGKRDSNEVYKCAKLETRYFLPDETYISRSLLYPVVKAYTAKFWQKSVYMVTGVKIVHGGTVETSRGEGFGAEVKVGLDGTPSGVPVGGGPKVKGERANKTTVKFGGSDDFVLGYQLIRIKSKKNGAFTEKDYNKWALLNDDDDDSRASVQVLKEMWDITELAAPSDDLDGIVVQNMTDSATDDCNVITLGNAAA